MNVTGLYDGAQGRQRLFSLSVCYSLQMTV